MAAVAGLTLVKRYSYRGDATEEFSNQYWLTGSVPSTSAAWRTLFDALVLQEKTLYTSACQVVRGYAYDVDTANAAAVWSVDLLQSPNTPVSGTLAVDASSRSMPGDVAVWVRWRTSRLNTKGKPIYLRKYFHDAYGHPSSGRDNVMASQITALNAFGSKLRDGTFTEARTLRSQHHDETLTGHGSSTYLTTRTLKRRGKRPNA